MANNTSKKNNTGPSNHEIFKLKVKYFDIEAGKQIAVLNEYEATEMDMFLSDRIGLKYNSKDITVIVDTSKTIVGRGEVGLYYEAAKALGLKGGETIEIKHRPTPESIEYIKKKMDRRSLSPEEIRSIVLETVENKLSEGELASFIAGAYINGFTIEETVALAKAMVETGEHLDLGVHPIADKHCLSGDVPLLIRNSGESKIKEISEVIDSVFDKCSPKEIENDYGVEFTNKNLNDLHVLVFDEKGEVSFKPVSGVFRASSPKEIYEIELVGNRKIKVTGDHTIFILKKGKITNIPALQLKKEDFVIVPSGFNRSNNINKIKIGEEEFEINKELMRLLGYYVSEGFTNYQGVFLNFGSHEEKLIKDAIECIEKIFKIKPTINKPHKTATRICIYRQKLAKDFEKLIMGSRALSKKIPPFIFELDKEMQKEFVRALFLGDGYVRRGYEAIYVTSSKELAIGLQYLLSLMGISVSLSKSKGKEKIFPKQSAMTQDAYYIYTQAREIFGGRKKANVSFLNLLPIKEIGEIDKEKIGWVIRKCLKNQDYMTKEKLTKIIGHIKEEDVKKILTGQISVLKIKNIEKIRSNSKYVYDVKVDDYNKFMAGTAPICVHNCVGGVAGNRTTLIIVPILAAAGIYIPKTSSRAITSPSGTADTMEVLAPVVVPIDEMRRIILKTHGCVIWGGAINLAPVDDKLIRIRQTLHLDPRGLLLASILGKKKAVGSEYVVVDIPIGRGAKIEDETNGKSLARDFIQVGEKLSMKIRCLITEGSDPIGIGIGPGLECKDILQVLQGNGPLELLDKGCLLAGNILEMVGKAPQGTGTDMALNIIKTGKAYDKMMEIVEAQGGNPKIKIDDLPLGKYKYEIKADLPGRVSHVDNRSISRIAKAAGAPKDQGAGIILRCEMGDKVNTGDILFEIISSSESNLSYAAKLVDEVKPVELQKMILGKME